MFVLLFFNVSIWGFNKGSDSFNWFDECLRVLWETIWEWSTALFSGKGCHKSPLKHHNNQRNDAYLKLKEYVEHLSLCPACKR